MPGTVISYSWASNERAYENRRTQKGFSPDQPRPNCSGSRILLSGDYTPWVNAGVYRELTRFGTTPIHTGEQIYLRQNFQELIEGHAVNVGGIAELKWIAEYAGLHSILMAPHGTASGLLGLAALIQVCATLPHNFIAFEYTTGDPDWWYDIVDGLPQTIVKDGFIDVIDRPGMCVDLVPERAGRYLAEDDQTFFD